MSFRILHDISRNEPPPRIASKEVKIRFIDFHVTLPCFPRSQIFAILSLSLWRLRALLKRNFWEPERYQLTRVSSLTFNRRSLYGLAGKRRKTGSKSLCFEHKIMFTDCLTPHRTVPSKSLEAFKKLQNSNLVQLIFIFPGFTAGSISSSESRLMDP